MPPRLVAAIAIDDPTALVERLRNEMAQLLREHAADEPHPYVAQRLREIADAFESDAGQPGSAIDAHQQHDGSYAPHAPLATRRP